VAFCAGTGALVFIDLIAALLMKNCLKHSRKLPEGVDFFEDDFKLHLYCAFRDRDTAIGLELINLLEKVTNDDSFKATIRLSVVEEGEVKKPRWTETYITE